MTQNAPTYLLTAPKCAVALALAVLMCWPIWVFDTQFVFDDTQSYLRGGRTIWQTLADLWAAPSLTDTLAEGSGVAQLSVDAGGKSTVGRSFTYSASAFAVQAVFGFWAIPLAQALFVALFVVALIEAPAPHWRVCFGLGLVAVLTTLPWFAVFLIPDVFAAVPILFGALLVGPFRTAIGWQQALFAALTAIAVSFHYGYPPLMMAVAGFALVWLAVTRALTLRCLMAAAVTVSFAPLLNLAASSAVLDTASAAPQRLPIPLARSLADGPAYWYLRDACPEADLALCEAFGADIPENIGRFLWHKDGVQSLSPALMARVRDEELLVIARAFRAYPLEQTASLFGNAARQVVLVGTAAIEAAKIGPEFAPQEGPEQMRVNAILRRIGPLLAWSTWIGAVPCGLLLISGRLTATQRGIVFVVLWGLLVNAAIFGGLSAPVERYQSRAIWLLPLLSALLLATASARRPDTAT